MPLGPYFIIQNCLTGEVLQVKKQAESSTQPVTTGYHIPIIQENDHQLWIFDAATSTIRNKLTGFCLDIQDVNGLQTMFVVPYQVHKESQKWRILEDQIQSETDFELVVSLVSETAEEGASVVVTTVVVAENTRDEFQLWNMTHSQAEFFYITNQYSEKVIDVRGGSPKAGSDLVLYAKWPGLKDNQLWYMGPDSIIRSKLNDFSMTASDGGVTLQPYTDSDRQQWTISGSRLQNMADDELVMDYHTPFFSPIPAIKAVKYTAHQSQHWFFEYPPNQSSTLNHSGAGKYMILRSRLNGAVMTVSPEEEETEGGVESQVIMAGQRPGPEDIDDQLWYFEDSTGVLRTALNDYCLDISECNQCVIRTFDPYGKNQQWNYKSGYIRNRHNLNLALQMETNEDGSLQLKPGDFMENDEYQMWDFEHLKAKCFYIRNVDSDLVMMVKDSKSSSGSLLMGQKQKTISHRQLWYEDETRNIRSKLNGYTIDTQESGYAKCRAHVVTNRKQVWNIAGDRIQNKFEPKLVLDVHGGSKVEKALVIEYKLHGGENQRWQFDYVDDI